MMGLEKMYIAVFVWKNKKDHVLMHSNVGLFIRWECIVRYLTGLTLPILIPFSTFLQNVEKSKDKQGSFVYT